jgi:acyl dehydratase
MAEGSIITDQLKKLIGMTLEPVILKVEEGAIQRYAQAIGDPSPMFNDVGYATKSKHGRLVCPPGFFGWPIKGEPKLFELIGALIQAGAPPNLLDGGVDFEFFEPIGAGDTLTMTAKIADMKEKASQSGNMLITTVEHTIMNQNGDVAAVSRMKFINR